MAEERLSEAQKVKRVAKNTLLLYVRMVFVLLISLYTSRIVLDSLGMANFGIVTVVGGLLGFTALFTASLSRAISRFINYELGKGDFQRLRTLFCTSVNIQIILALIVAVAFEIIGNWAMYHGLDIPADRIPAAQWLLHCSIISLALSLTCAPYSASIVAHEKMHIYAYISIYDVAAKLLTVYSLYVAPWDKLITYATLNLAVSISLQIFYRLYCIKNFKECRYRPQIDIKLVKEMGSFAGWSTLGVLSGVLNNQGVELLMNVFFGLTVNAARGVAASVNRAMSAMTSNFTVAVNPQIIQSYAEGNLDFMHRLVCAACKYSYLLVFIVAVPILTETYAILDIWLVDVPEHAVLFTRLTLIATMISMLGYPLLTAAQASGNIKRYQTISACVDILTFPISWGICKLGAPCYAPYIVLIICYLALNILNGYLLKGLVGMPFRMFLTRVILKLMVISTLSFIVPLLLLGVLEPSFLRLVLVCGCSIPATLLIIYTLGSEAEEQQFICDKTRALLAKWKARRSQA